MFGSLLSALAWFHQFSDPLAWLVLATFLTGTLLARYDEDLSERVFVLAWGTFAAFWFTLMHFYLFEQKSIIEGLGSVVAVPASLYVAYLLWNGRSSLTVLSRAVAVMGLIYFPFETLAVLRRPLVELVTRQVEFLLSLLGYHPQVINGSSELLPLDVDPYRNTFFFEQEGNHRITYTILLACTGLGSMSIFAGLVAAVRAPLRRKLRAAAIALPVIYALNLVRNVFIAVSFGYQKLHVFPDVIMGLFALDDPYTVSYYLADRILAQSMSVVALVVITFLVVRELPEILDVIEELLFMVTGTEYDLRTELDVDAPPVRADGEGRR
ncbi:archaeosortase A [Haloarculaceae archaeon H-GB11]|nr:archaeosortase A [Haloarculaceae archaeon H-GB11]